MKGWSERIHENRADSQHCKISGCWNRWHWITWKDDKDTWLHYAVHGHHFRNAKAVRCCFQFYFHPLPPCYIMANRWRQAKVVALYVTSELLSIFKQMVVRENSRKAGCPLILCYITWPTDGARPNLKFLSNNHVTGRTLGSHRVHFHGNGGPREL